MRRRRLAGEGARRMSEREALDSFLDKWRARWPEWAVAQVFVPAHERESTLAWSSLLQELTDAAWGGSDRRPGEAKLGWWVEELQGWTRGARRHPLGLVLQRQPAPWGTLAAALPGLLESRERPLDPAHARSQLAQAGRAVAAIELALFAPPGADAEDAAEAALTSLLHARQADHSAEAVPLQFLALGEQGAAAGWQRELADRSTPGKGVPGPRRIMAALALVRLRRGDAARPLPVLSALLTAWRAARG
jgi:phytoene/squalene synthetase